MSAQPHRIGTGTMVFIKLFSLLSASGIMVIYLASKSAVAFNFRWTNYAILPIISFITSLVLISVLNLKKNRNRVTFWYSIYVVVGSIWQIGETTKILSANTQTYTFWHYLTYPTVSAFITPIMLVFVFVYLDREDLIFRFTNAIALLGGATATYYLMLTSDKVFMLEKLTRKFYGYPASPPPGQYGSILSLASVTISLTAAGLLIHYYRSIKAGSIIRKQLRLLIVGMTIPTIAGGLSEVILPALHVVTFQVDPIVSLFASTMTVYAILHYRVFRVDPSTLSNTVLSKMSESVITISTDHEIEMFNPGAIEIFQKTETRLERGKSLDELFGETNKRSIVETLDEVSSSSLELDIVGKNGTLPISLLSSKMEDQNGQALGYVLVFRDISKERAVKNEIENQVTERTKQLNEEHAKLQSAIDSLQLGFLMTFKDHTELSYNGALAKMLNLHDATADPAETLHVNLDLIGAEFKKSSYDLLAAIEKCQQNGKAFDKNEVTYGSRIFSIFGAPVIVKKTEIIGSVILIEDITEAKIMKRSKDEFFSIASHELRTPLTSIKGNSSMILDYFKEALKDPELKEMVEDMHESADRLIDIVNDFLDLSRLEQGKVSFAFEPVEIESVIESVAYEMHAVLNEKKLNLVVDKLTLGKLPKVWGDKGRLKQVVYNLVGNAYKFTDTGSITIKAELVTDAVKVIIADTGRGMSPESQQLLFHKLQQAGDSLLTRDTTRGTGLGLYISKMITEGMGGKVILENSAEGKGSTFSFTVPLATAELIASAAAKETTTDSTTGLTAEVT